MFYLAGATSIMGCHRQHIICLIALLLLVFFGSCNNEHAHIGEKVIVEKPEDINEKAEVVIQATLKDVLQNNKELPDSLRIKNAPLLEALYHRSNFQPLWSTEGKIHPLADSLLRFIDSSRLYGLFPSDYYQQKLGHLHIQLLDTSKQNKLDASKWAHFDLLLTSGLVQMVKDLYRGRLVADTTLAKDSSLSNDFFEKQFATLQEVGPDSLAKTLEPRHAAYDSLKKALPLFLAKANFKNYTLIQNRDSSLLPGLVYQRLAEEDSLQLEADSYPDSLTVSNAIKAYQKWKKQKQDGKISSSLIEQLNNTDKEKFIRVAITLDRYKTLRPLPVRYLWVNIPSYYMHLHDSDSIALTSKVVVGKPITRTPVLTSAINYMVTYPKWTIPESIIQKEILPGLKRDPGYLRKKGYALFDGADNEIDPYGVDWSKYSKGIPYKVVQGSGDANALGVMKFNFENKYSVYLHDTNQRYLFSRSKRSLSHGCVRVEAWRQLADYLLMNDSIQTGKSLPIDSLNTWLAMKEKHWIPVRSRLPLFIQYYTCDVKGGKLRFYEDIYGEDRKLRDRFFNGK